jgi:hypothetical protein
VIHNGSRRFAELNATQGGSEATALRSALEVLPVSRRLRASRVVVAGIERSLKQVPIMVIAAAALALHLVSIGSNIAIAMIVVVRA